MLHDPRSVTSVSELVTAIRAYESDDDSEQRSLAQTKITELLNMLDIGEDIAQAFPLTQTVVSNAKHGATQTIEVLKMKTLLAQAQENLHINEDSVLDYKRVRD